MCPIPRGNCIGRPCPALALLKPDLRPDGDIQQLAPPEGPAKHAFRRPLSAPILPTLKALCIRGLTKAVVQLTQDAQSEGILATMAIMDYLTELVQLSHSCSNAQLRGPARSVKLQVGGNLPDTSCVLARAC